MGKIEEQNKQIVRDFMETFSTGNIDAFMEFMSDTATWWVAGTIDGISGEKGMKEFREMNSGIANTTKTGAISLTPLAVTAEGNRVAVETESYCELNNGRVYNNLYHFLFVIENGKIEKVKEYLDTEHTRKVFLD
ncbi:nuclear transport factor 2 family protein [Bacillus sp. B15-48]|uniref:nuclear transport factor 2 family protein n=1 Tax=Bacillus sp. B15-48 TaxID=1548601 RepID=UPI00193F350B|nr:nuclear transport factor 2 family protein [Bacillus sp. B15-48]MBM4761833.1 nuclear transport factor 2 family protein [Bacillus sp. B15-48]